MSDLSVFYDKIVSAKDDLNECVGIVVSASPFSIYVAVDVNTTVSFGTCGGGTKPKIRLATTEEARLWKEKAESVKPLPATEMLMAGERLMDNLKEPEFI